MLLTEMRTEFDLLVLLVEGVREEQVRTLHDPGVPARHVANPHQAQNLSEIYAEQLIFILSKPDWPPTCALSFATDAPLARRHRRRACSERRSRSRRSRQCRYRSPATAM